jgi:uncharacterized protein (TIGR02246 family)
MQIESLQRNRRRLQMSNEEAIRRLIGSWARAVHRRDIAAVVQDHAADLLMFDVTGPDFVEGIEAYRQTWTDLFFPWHGTDGAFALNDLRVTASDTLAFATALIDCRGTEGGTAVAYTIRLTVGLEKRDGHWTVTHEHHSQTVPYEEDALNGRTKK